MPAIGILGGMGPQASTKLIELIISETSNYFTTTLDCEFPRIVYLSVPVPNFISNKQNVDIAKKMLLEETRLLELAGCSINGIACNTAHILLPELEAATAVPFLSIPQLVAEEVRQRAAHRVGLLGTPVTLASDLFDIACGPDVVIVRPGAYLAGRLEEAIVETLNGGLERVDVGKLRCLIKEFQERQRLDAVILGCTELTLVFGGVPDAGIIDTLQLLASALLRAYFRSSAPSEHTLTTCEKAVGKATPVLTPRTDASSSVVDQNERTPSSQ